MTTKSDPHAIKSSYICFWYTKWHFVLFIHLNKLCYRYGAIVTWWKPKILKSADIGILLSRTRGCARQAPGSDIDLTQPRNETAYWWRHNGTRTDLFSPNISSRFMAIYIHAKKYCRYVVHRSSTPVQLCLIYFYIIRTGVLVDGIHSLEPQQNRPLCRNKGTCNTAPLPYLDEDAGTTVTHWLSRCFMLKYGIYRWMGQIIHNTLIVVDPYLQLMGDKTIPD